MKKYIVLSCALCVSLMGMAQGEYDAFKYSQTELLGSARYVSMAGAFGALGGDMSAISLNPAGIGVYRSSELSLTPVVGLSATTSDFNGTETSDAIMNIRINNFGYVGTIRPSNSTINNINFGISYNKVKDFNRTTYIKGYDRSVSLLDVICSNTGTTEPSDLTNLGYLAYETYLINRNDNDGSYYNELRDGETVNNEFFMQEEGSIGVWDFTLGANMGHFLYAGLSIGLMGIDYRMVSSYYEYTEAFQEGTVTYDPFDYELRNAISTQGNGVNLKIGAIIRPVSFIRLGVALHSPTYYSLTDTYGSSMFSNGLYDQETGEYASSEIIDEDSYDYELITPGKIVGSAAIMFGKKGILSIDCEVVDYRGISLKSTSGFPYDDANSDIDDHMQNTLNLRGGGEYRVTDNISLRAGIAFYGSAYKNNMTADNTYIETVGTTPYYAFDLGTTYLTGGIGYRTGSFFLDAALVNQSSIENFYNFYDSDVTNATRTDNAYATVNNNKINAVVSTGFRF